jgi:hypothetical protein
LEEDVQTTDDFALGTHALIGRAIGEVNGLQRRIDILEREVFVLQERLDSRPTRADFRFFIAALFALMLVAGGALVTVHMTWAGTSPLQLTRELFDRATAATPRG